MFDQGTGNEYLTTPPNCDSVDSVRSEDYAHPKEGVNLLHDMHSPGFRADLNMGD